jgi:hypothetical protein
MHLPSKNRPHDTRSDRQHFDVILELYHEDLTSTYTYRAVKSRGSGAARVHPGSARYAASTFDSSQKCHK